MLDSLLNLRFVEAGEGIPVSGWIHNKRIPFIIVAQATNGSYEVISKNGHIVTQGTEAFLTPADIELSIIHHAAEDGTPMHFRYAHLQFMICDTIDLSALFQLPPKTDSAKGAVLGEWIEQLLDCMHPQQGFEWKYAARRKEIGYRILNELLDISEPNQFHEHFFYEANILVPILTYMSENLGNPEDVDTLVSRFHLSRTALFQLFKKVFERSPIAYWKQIRLQEAYKMLCATNTSINEIAYQYGFATRNHFSREFKKEYKMTPSESRKYYHDLHHSNQKSGRQ